METVQFVQNTIENKLRPFLQFIPKTESIDYYFDRSLDAHYLLIPPELYTNEEFTKAEVDIILTFIHENINDELTFLPKFDDNIELIEDSNLVKQWFGKSENSKTNISEDTTFTYELDIQDHEIENLWAVVEETTFPDVFVSSKENVLINIEVDEENCIEKWILINVKDVKSIIKFLQGESTYGDLINLKDNKFLLIRVDLNEHTMIVEKEVDIDFVRDKLKNILDEKRYSNNEYVEKNVSNVIKFYKKKYEETLKI